VIHLTRLNSSEPLLKPRQLDWETNGILNPGVTVYDGKILLLYRSVGTDGISRFGVATSTDGVNFDYASDQPVFSPDPSSTYEERGVEDPRITFIDGQYAIVYVAASINKTDLRPNAIDWKTRVSLAFTRDFKDFTRRGVIIHSYNDKNAALFPVKWGEWYYLYHRRHPSIWLSKSQDLNTWEDVCETTCMVVTPDGNSWDNDRIGIGTQPIYTDEGWLVFYHGRDKQGVYRLSAFLADHQSPQNITAKLPYPILEPELPFEQNGTIPNVVFTCGAVEAGDHFWVYYGGADHAIGGAVIEKKVLLEELVKYKA
jgi:beta-1,2-mannobiose phosphorylase / 1,2-beta-oligomannan phosphorylase